MSMALRKADRSPSSAARISISHSGIFMGVNFTANFLRLHPFAAVFEHVSVTSWAEATIGSQAPSAQRPVLPAPTPAAPPATNYGQRVLSPVIMETAMA